MAEETLRLGFIGLDPLGRAIVQRLLAHGYEVLIADHRREVVEALETLGAIALPTPLLVAEEVDILLTLLDGDTTLFELFSGPEGALDRLRPGAMVIDLTSATPMTMQQLAADAALRGVALVDAPVSGAPASALRGELTAMVGAAPETFERTLPLLQVFAKSIYRVGDPGMGKLVKLLTQLLTGVSLVVFGEALALATRAGADLDALADVVRASTGGWPLWHESVAYLLGQTPAPEQESLARLRHDLERVLRLGADLDCPVPLSALAYQFSISSGVRNPHLAPAADIARAVARFAGVHFARSARSEV